MTTEVLDPWAALGDRRRREILTRLVEQPLSVADIARDLPVSRPAVSQHLKVLKDAGLVRAEPRGRQRIYVARPEGLDALRSELDGFWRTALASFKRVAEARENDPTSTIREERT